MTAVAHDATSTQAVGHRLVGAVVTSGGASDGVSTSSQSLGRHSASGSSSAGGGAMNTTIGWPSSISRDRSSWSAADRRVSTTCRTGWCRRSGTSSSRPSAAEAVDEALPHARRTRPAARACGGRTGDLDGVRDVLARRRRSRRSPGGSGRRPRARGRARCVGDRHAEELVGGDVEPPALQLVEQAEAGTADVGGVAPAHQVTAVGPCRRADARRRRRRTSARPARRRPSLRRSSGCSASAKATVEASDATTATWPAATPTTVDGPSRSSDRRRDAPPGQRGPHHGADEHRRDAPGPEREVVPRPPEDAGHRHRAEEQGHGDDGVQRPQCARADAPGHDGGDHPHRRA